jgi:hypothetical protein
MKTTIFQSVFCILVIATTVLSSCKKEDQIVSGTVSGTVKVYDPSAPLVKNPVSGIKVYLIKSDYKADTVNFDKNMAAILDSVLTDSNGKYQFANLTLGNYAVVPVQDAVRYQFEFEDSSTPKTFPINNASSSLSVNFKASIPSFTNSDNTFEMYVKVSGIPTRGFFKIKRQRLILAMIPHFDSVLGDYWSSFKIVEVYGSYIFVDLITNNFLIEAYDGSEYVASFWITWPDISNTPKNSTWELNWTAKTIKKTS